MLHTTRLHVLLLLLAVIPWPQLGLAWAHEGHQIIALIAEHHVTASAKAKATALLGGSAIDAIASWADGYRRDHPETAPWHYINCPLVNSRCVLAGDVK